MKASPALPTVSPHEVHRRGLERAGRKQAVRATAADAPAPFVGADGVLRVANRRLGIACPCASPAVAAQLNEFFSR